MTRILLTGGTGQLGIALQALEWSKEIQVIAPARANLDLKDKSSIASYLKHQSFDAVINAGAYTAVDKAESEPALAHAVNAEAPGILAEWCAVRRIPLMHISTDYVFRGDKAEAYKETDTTEPVSVYGQTKRAGELAVQAANPRHLILRTSWVVSPHGQNFVKTMLRLGAERSHLRIVSDQRGSPTIAADLAQAIQTLVIRQLNDYSTESGFYHFTNAGYTTWYGLAQEIFRLAAERGHRIPTLEPIAASDYPTAARRPANSRLDCTKITSDFAISPRHWTVALEAMMTQMLPLQSGDALS